ncbi:MAG: NUDIX hydrolase [Desulfobacterales bacterium]|nr:NUDIX hydrolase [Desulfobacterales bacterium]
MQLIPAATVIVLRHAQEVPEILLLHRHPGLAVQGNVWVFPGGRLEPSDGPPDDTLRAVRACAVREAWEESGLRLAPEALVPMSRWVTPEALPKRYDTWFFIAVPNPVPPVRIDQREIVDYRWYSARDAIDAHHAGRILLSPPGFVLLSQLAALASLDMILAQVTAAPPPHYRPRLVFLPDGACTLYEQDAGYAKGDLRASGPRHRLWMGSAGWRYEESSQV